VDGYREARKAERPPKVAKIKKVRVGMSRVSGNNKPVALCKTSLYQSRDAALWLAYTALIPVISKAKRKDAIPAGMVRNTGWNQSLAEDKLEAAA